MESRTTSEEFTVIFVAIRIEEEGGYRADDTIMPTRPLPDYAEAAGAKQVPLNGMTAYRHSCLFARRTRRRARYFVPRHRTKTKRSEEHKSELTPLMRSSYAVSCLKN